MTGTSLARGAKAVQVRRVGEPDLSDDEPLSRAEYEGLAGFRHHVRRFFAFSEEAIVQAGLTPGQYQAMLAIKAHPDGALMTVSDLAERLLVRLNTAVEQVDRLAAAGLVSRARSPADRRRTVLTLTTIGEAKLAALARAHLDRHREHLPELLRLVGALLPAGIRSHADARA